MPVRMNKNIGRLIAACTLFASAASQEETLDDIFAEEEDPQLQDIWPTYSTTQFISIREGSTEYNFPGFWQEGNFSTVTNIIGDQDLEVQLILHNPQQVEDQMYMQWIQVLDPSLSEKMQQNHYESYSCSIEYKAATEAVDYKVVYPKGYKGPGELRFASGQPDKLLENEQTSSYPWTIDRKNDVLPRCSIETDEVQGTGTETCSFKRDFATSFSDILIKADVKLKVKVGYKMYTTKFWSFPKYKGYSGDEHMEWTVVEGSGAISLLAATATTLVMTAMQLSF